MKAVTAMRAAGLAVLCASAATAANAEVRVERLADGSLQMVNQARTVPRGAAAGFRSRSEIDDLIDTHASRQGLDPDLVRAVVTVESSYNPGAQSEQGAMGLMQLMPATASSLQVDNPYDPDENLRGGTIYLRRMLDRFGGDLELALAGYNAGPEAVDRYRGLPPYPETRGYVNRVLQLFRGEGSGPAIGGDGPTRRTYLHRDAGGRLVLSTARPTGS